jgi:hypothetical protein
MFEPIAISTFDKAWEGMRKKAIELLSFGIFDDGGWLPRGLSLALNRTQRPEAVVPSNTLNNIEKLITVSQQTIERLRTGSSRPAVTFHDGAFKITINGDADAVTINELQRVLRDWSDEIIHEFEGRR